MTLSPEWERHIREKWGPEAARRTLEKYGIPWDGPCPAPPTGAANELPVACAPPWPSWVCPKETEDRVRGQVQKKNRKMRYNNLKKDYQTRFIGRVAELGCIHWLEEENQVPVLDLYREDEKDEWDLSLPLDPGVRIDVKALSTSVYPRPHHACEVNEDQLQRSKATHFLFCRYNIITRTVYILGYLPVPEFKAVAARFDVGDVRPRDNGTELPVESPFWELPISALRPPTTIFLP